MVRPHEPAVPEEFVEVGRSRHSHIRETLRSANLSRPAHRHPTVQTVFQTRPMSPTCENSAMICPPAPPLKTATRHPARRFASITAKYVALAANPPLLHGCSPHTTVRSRFPSGSPVPFL